MSTPHPPPPPPPPPRPHSSAPPTHPPSFTAHHSPPCASYPPSYDLQSEQFYRKQFVLVGPSGPLPAAPVGTLPYFPPNSLSGKVAALLYQHLPAAIATASITDAYLTGRQDRVSRVHFVVHSVETANSIVQWRHLLRGTGFTIFDVLSPLELERHRALWPRFLAARQAGSRAQFQRDRLYIDRVLVVT